MPNVVIAFVLAFCKVIRRTRSIGWFTFGNPFSEVVSISIEYISTFSESHYTAPGYFSVRY